MWVCFHLHIIGLKSVKFCLAKKRPRLIQVVSITKDSLWISSSVGFPHFVKGGRQFFEVKTMHEFYARVLYLISWSRGNILSFLNNGAVWALKGALLMMRMGCFCFFRIFSKLVVLSQS
jgi:hypothetical protein